MRCPECQSNVETGAAACPSCGLILFKLAADDQPKRRAEDYAGQKRRSNDREMTTCTFCSGAIEANAIRCRHCSEIVNEDFYRESAKRLRARINYASWVAYLFGLGALLVFRPVGLLSIASGLLLSICYYAIPVEPPTAKNAKRPGSAWNFLRKQFGLERVAISLPAMRNKKLVFVGTPLIAALVGYSANLFLLQEPVNHVLKENSAFNGMNVSAHYEYWVVPGVIVYDLRSLSVKQTPIDVHTAFLEFAKKVREKRYSRVELSYRGVTKFSIDGASFRKLGEEYTRKNFDYVLYKFPKLFHSADGRPMPPTGDRDALLEFHRHWYGEDQLTKPVQNGM